MEHRDQTNARGWPSSRALTRGHVVHLVSDGRPWKPLPEAKAGGIPRREPRELEAKAEGLEAKAESTPRRESRVCGDSGIERSRECS